MSLINNIREKRVFKSKFHCKAGRKNIKILSRCRKIT